jgi:hypothetical protein
LVSHLLAAKFVEAKPAPRRGFASAMKFAQCETRYRAGKRPRHSQRDPRSRRAGREKKVILFNLDTAT